MVFGLYTESVTDWDAARYDRVSNPQLEWGRRVIARLAPAPGERVLDLGCGTGRLTVEIAVAVPDGLVVGLDPSAAMLDVARQAAPAVTSTVRSGGLRFVRGNRIGAAVCRRIRRRVQQRDAPLDRRSRFGISQHPWCAATGWSVRGAVRRRSKPGAPLLARRFADAPSVFRALLRRVARPMAFRAARRHASGTTAGRVRCHRCVARRGAGDVCRPGACTPNSSSACASVITSSGCPRPSTSNFSRS